MLNTPQCLQGFLDAIIKARGLSIIDRLIQNDHTLAQINLEPRTVVIKQALDFLLSIHRFLYTTPDDKFIQEFLYNSENRRIIETLLDLISLEGVYPTLLSGVGIPIERRVKSVLQGGLVTRPTGTVDKQTNNPKNGLLEEIVVDLVCVATCKGNGLGGIMKERALVDLIAALGQLGYGSSDDKSESYRRVLEKVLDEYVASFSSIHLYLYDLVHNFSIVYSYHQDTEITLEFHCRFFSPY